MRLIHKKRQHRRERAVYARVVRWITALFMHSVGAGKDEDARQHRMLRACCGWVSQLQGIGVAQSPSCSTYHEHERPLAPIFTKAASEFSRSLIDRPYFLIFIALDINQACTRP